MKTWSVTLICLFTLSAMAQERPRAATNLGDGKDAVAADESHSLALTGIMHVGKTAYAAIRDLTSSRVVWYMPDESFGQYTLHQILKDRVIVYDRTSQKEFVVMLSKLAVQQQEDNGVPAPYSPAWINSKQNPMLHARQPLPEDLLRNWRNLSAEERAAIVKYYEQHGWKLVSVEIDGGAASFIWDNIYEKERSAVMKANKAAFEATLKPEQAARWENMKVNKPIKSTGGQFTPEQQAEIAARRQAFEKFRSSLTKEQIETYDNITDFTKANWSTQRNQPR